MVKKPRKPESTTILIDVAGASVTVMASLALVYLLFLRGDSVASDAAQLGAVVAELRSSSSQIQRATHEQQSLLATRRAHLEAGSGLPEVPPVDEYFLLLNDLIHQNRLLIRAHEPLPGRSYSGVHEHRFSYTISGRWGDLANLMAEIERSPFWADVGFFRIEPPPTSDRGDPEERLATLTFCLFYSPVEVERVKGGSG